VNVGKRSPIEATVAIIAAFLDRRTWKQADLARHVEVEPRALRKHLDEMVLRGFPLERDEDSPQVYWSMSKGWFPGGLLLDNEHVDALVRLLCRLPRSKQRNQLLDRITSTLPRRAEHTAQLQAVLPDGGEEAPYLGIAAQAAAERQPLFFRYYSAKRGSLDSRHASVERVLVGPPARMVARCHLSSTLKWFRVDNILNARLDPDVQFQPTPPEEVNSYLGSSLDGFTSGEPAQEHRFFVPDPDARWVKNNLIPPMVAELIPGGIRVTCNTSAPLRLARFVLSLAPVARAETPELAALVTELATATLANHQRAKLLPHEAHAALNSGATPRRRGRIGRA
jgi:predicted DNA-binding transcriptional regulator YafY